MSDKTKENEITIDDLAIMINSGFNKIENEISELKKDVSGLKKAVFEQGCDIRELKTGQEKHSKEINELKDVVNGVFRIEMMDLKKRVALLEERVGIVA